MNEDHEHCERCEDREDREDRLPSWWADDLAGLTTCGLLRQRRTVTALPDGWCECDGKRLRNFAGNDYLDLAGDARVVTAAKQALDECGHGSRASALVIGRSVWHARLEERLAKFENVESVLLFPSGYAANLGTVSSLVGPGDTVFCDRLNHASLIDGCRLSGARLRVYRRDRLELLKRELKKATNSERRLSSGRRLIVTDGLFSMAGDLAPLRDLCDLSERFDAAVLVDEAHATGLFGKNGRGICERESVEDRVAVRVGTLSKAVGALGGFVAGSRELIDFLFNTARTQMFSTALPPSVCAAAIAALDAITEEPFRRETLHSRSQQLRDGLRELGHPIPESCVGPIVPILIGDPEPTLAAAAKLQTQGFLVPGIRPPTVSAGTSRLRLTVSCAHGEDDIDTLLGAIRETVPASTVKFLADRNP